MSEKQATELAENSETAVIPASLQSELAQDANLGMESATYEDLLIPRVRIVQSNSPELISESEKYIPDAKIGDIVDSIYGINFGTSIIFIPVIFRREYPEWKPRNQGGGLVNIHQSREVLNNTNRVKGKAILPNGNIISPTLNFYGMIHHRDGFRQCIISMAATQLKKGRKIITLSKEERMQDSDGNMFTPPMYARAYLLTGTANEQNAEGRWKGWTVAQHYAIGDFGELAGYDEAAFLALARSTAHAVQSDEFRTEPDEQPDAPKGNSGDDIPL